MSLLVADRPLIVLPKLALKVGLNEAMILQQLHFRLQYKTKEHDGHHWVFYSYEEWRHDFPFWSARTIQRTLLGLEELGFVVSGVFNRIKSDRKKWYRVNYGQLGILDMTDCQEGLCQTVMYDGDKLAQRLTEDLNKTKEDSAVARVVAYLNERAGTSFQATSKATAKFVRGRLRDGHSEADLWRVVDMKCAEWLGDMRMQKYLRPSTLFNATNFVNYLHGLVDVKDTEPTYGFALDYTDGEDA